MKTQKPLKKVLAVILTGLMLCSAFPMGVFASEEQPEPEGASPPVVVTIETTDALQTEAVPAEAEAPSETLAPPAETLSPESAPDSAIVAANTEAAVLETASAPEPQDTALEAAPAVPEEDGPPIIEEEKSVTTLTLQGSRDMTLTLQNGVLVQTLKIGGVSLIENSAITGNTVAGAVFDPATTTLTLNGLTLAMDEVYANAGSNTINILIQGTNTIRNLRVDGNCVIDGSGTLTARQTNGWESGNHNGVIETTRDLTINGATISAEASDTGYSYLLGILARGNLTINDGIINARAENPAAVGANVFGIDANGHLTINGGRITATGINHSTSTFGEGINGEGALIINGGTVIATGSAVASQRGFGLLSSSGDIALNGGDITAIGLGPESGALLYAKNLIISEAMILREGDFTETQVAGYHGVLGDRIHVADTLAPEPEPEPIPKPDPLAPATIITTPAGVNSVATLSTVSYSGNPDTGLAVADASLLNLALGLLCLSATGVLMLFRFLKKD